MHQYGVRGTYLTALLRALRGKLAIYAAMRQQLERWSKKKFCSKVCSEVSSFTGKMEGTCGHAIKREINFRVWPLFWGQWHVPYYEPLMQMKPDNDSKRSEKTPKSEKRVPQPISFIFHVCTMHVQVKTSHIFAQLQKWVTNLRRLLWILDLDQTKQK